MAREPPDERTIPPALRPATMWAARRPGNHVGVRVLRRVAAMDTELDEEATMTLLGHLVEARVIAVRS